METRTFYRWLKFNLVGGIGIGVQLAVLAALRSGLHVSYIVATALAVETAVLHNYVWHERYTWVDRGRAGIMQSLARFARFNISNGVASLVVNLVLMRLLVGALGLHYLIGNLAAIATCSIVNFLLSDRFVFEGPVQRGGNAGSGYLSKRATITERSL